MKNTILKLMSLAVCASTLSACTPGSVVITNTSDPYKRAWFDVYGNKCIQYGYPAPGCNFYANFDKIVAGEDPYYNSSALEAAYDLPYYDSYGDLYYFTGLIWRSPTGIYYDQYGYALNEREGSEVSADVVAEAAKKERELTISVGQTFAKENALSEEKGIMISKTLQSWATIGKLGRARTLADQAEIAKQMYGVDATKLVSTLKTAVVTQSQKPLDELNVDIAAHWGTSPENSKKVIKRWYAEQVKAYGIK